MNKLRPAAARRVLKDGDEIAIPLPLRIAEGITSYQSVGKEKVDMGARCERRELLVVGRAQLPRIDAKRFVDDGLYENFEVHNRHPIRFRN